jgi:hypothetical protein
VGRIREGQWIRYVGNCIYFIEVNGMKKLLILMFVLVAATISVQAQTVQCQTANGAWGPCQFVSPVATAQGVNSKVSAGAGTTITNAFASSTTAGNSILCIAFESAAAIPVITDGQTNTYVVASSSTTAPGYTVALASNIVGGTTDTITETTASGAASFSCYELKGTVSVGQLWDYVSAQQTTSTAITFAAQTAAMPNEMAFVAVGMGGGTVNATPAVAGVPSGLTTVDQSNTTPSGGAALSIFYSAHANVTNVPTFTQAVSISAAETYSAVLVSVKPIAINETFGPVNITQTAGGTLSKTNPLFTNIADGTNQLTADLSPYGTAPTGTEALGVNAFITNTPSVGLSTGSNTVGKVDILGNSGATMDSLIGAGSAPTNGLAIIGQFNSSAPTLTTGQTVAMQLAQNGSLIVQPYRRSQIFTQTTTITSASIATILAAPPAGIFADITNLIITTTTSGTSNPFTVQITDGTAIYTFDLNTNQAVGPPTINITFNPPLAATSAAHIWQQTNSSATPTTHTTVVAVKQANF